MIVRDALLRDELIQAKFNTVISCSRVDEALALRVLEAAGLYLPRARHTFGARSANLPPPGGPTSPVGGMGRPDAGALCCVRLRPAAFDDTAVRRFYETLMGEGVRVANGSWFGEPARVFRLGFGLLSPVDLERLDSNGSRGAPSYDNANPRDPSFYKPGSPPVHSGRT